MRAEGQEGWRGGLESVVFVHRRLCLSVCVCVAFSTLCHFPSASCRNLIPPALLLFLSANAKLQFNIWRPWDPWGNAWMCRAQRQNPSLSSWKAGFLYTHAGWWQFVWSQETKSWVECVCVSVLKPVCVHRHSWLAGLRYCRGLWASRTLCVCVIAYTLVLDFTAAN